MDHIFVEKPYTQEKSDIMENLTNNLIKSMSDDMKICMLAGVEIETTVYAKGDKMMFAARTKYPVSILRDEKGRVIDIYQKKS